jgi:hypothetical protein
MGSPQAGENIPPHRLIEAALHLTAKLAADVAEGVKLSGKGTFSTRPVTPNDRTLPVLPVVSVLHANRTA